EAALLRPLAVERGVDRPGQVDPRLVLEVELVEAAVADAVLLAVDGQVGGPVAVEADPPDVPPVGEDDGLAVAAPAERRPGRLVEVVVVLVVDERGLDLLGDVRALAGG